MVVMVPFVKIFRMTWLLLLVTTWCEKVHARSHDMCVKKIHGQDRTTQNGTYVSAMKISPFSFTHDLYGELSLAATANPPSPVYPPVTELPAIVVRLVGGTKSAVTHVTNNQKQHNRVNKFRVNIFLDCRDILWNWSLIVTQVNQFAEWGKILKHLWPVANTQRGGKLRQKMRNPHALTL